MGVRIKLDLACYNSYRLNGQPNPHPPITTHPHTKTITHASRNHHPHATTTTILPPQSLLLRRPLSHVRPPSQTQSKSSQDEHFSFEHLPNIQKIIQRNLRQQFPTPCLYLNLREQPQKHAGEKIANEEKLYRR